MAAAATGRVTLFLASSNHHPTCSSAAPLTTPSLRGLLHAPTPLLLQKLRLATLLNLKLELELELMEVHQPL